MGPAPTRAVRRPGAQLHSNLAKKRQQVHRNKSYLDVVRHYQMLLVVDGERLILDADNDSTEPLLAIGREDGNEFLRFRDLLDGKFDRKVQHPTDTGTIIKRLLLFVPGRRGRNNSGRELQHNLFHDGDDALPVLGESTSCANRYRVRKIPTTRKDRDRRPNIIDRAAVPYPNCRSGFATILTFQRL